MDSEKLKAETATTLLMVMCGNDDDDNGDNRNANKIMKEEKTGLRSFYGAINLMKHAMWTYWAEAGRAVPIRIVCAIEAAIYAIYGAI